VKTFGASFPAISCVFGNETACALKDALKDDVEVTVVHRSDPYKALLGTEIGNCMREVNLSKGVNYTKGNLEKINQGGSGKVEAVLINGQIVKADLLILANGVTPNTEFLPNSVKKDKTGHVTCDTFMRTTDHNIWAAGDSASHPWGFNGERISSAHYSTAITEGAIAAFNMMGKWVPNTNVPIFWTSQTFAAKVFFSGHGSNWDKIIVDGDVKENKFIGYHFKDGRVEGISCMGRTADILLLNTSQRLGMVLTEADFKDGKLDLEDLRKRVDAKTPSCMCKRKTLNEAGPIECRGGL